MNVIESANDDEDFPVFKAGPPIPVRTKKSNTKSQRVGERDRNSKVKNGPLLPLKPPLSSTSTQIQGNVTQSSLPTTGLKRESKVKKYIERVKASDELGRKNRIMPERMLSLEDLYQVNVINSSPSDNLNLIKPKINESSSCANNEDVFLPSSNSQENDKLISVTEVQDKLRETLRIVKEKDALISKLRESCHDLAIKCADAENRVDELRFSYGRCLDGQIGGESSSKLTSHRGSVCGDIKNEQNTLQFSNLRKCSSEEGLNICADYNETNKPNGKQGLDKNQEKETVKSAKLPRAFLQQTDKQTQIDSGSLCDDITGTGGWNKNGGKKTTDQEVGHWRDDDEILQESCSNWMEKVQNWKTDSNFNLSQDSGGDRDSGFRGSAEIDIESVRKQHSHRHSSLPRSSSSKKSKCQGHHKHHHHHCTNDSSGKLLKIPSPSSQFLSSSAQMSTTQIPQMSSSSTTTITGIPGANTTKEADKRGGAQPELKSTQNEKTIEDELGQLDSNESQHFWPSFSSSQSHFNLAQYQADNLPSTGTKAKSLFYELAEADRNKCNYFHKEDVCKSHHHKHHHHHHYYHSIHRHNHHHRLCEAKSLDALYLPPKSSNSEELRSLIDSSFEPPEYILKAHLDAQHRSIDKTVKMLDPLLTDATEIALRVKKKSERLAKMLEDTCTFE